MPANITIVGNLGRDPETRYTPNGRMNVSLNVAVSHRFRDQGGQQQERTNWFRVTAWGTQAENLDRMAQQGWLAKGRPCLCLGDSKRANTPGTTARNAPRSISQRTKSSLSAHGPTETVAVRLAVEATVAASKARRPVVTGPRAAAGGGERFDDLPDSGDVDDIPF